MIQHNIENSLHKISIYKTIDYLTKKELHKNAPFSERDVFLNNYTIESGNSIAYLTSYGS